ncbi:hypothetical protein HDU78_000785 [Chytriomyces hyalinus]|nr:hypothetical protein HDU78_000785 [Chytriomyces hyalinus]
MQQDAGPAPTAPRGSRPTPSSEECPAFTRLVQRVVRQFYNQRGQRIPQRVTEWEAIVNESEVFEEYGIGARQLEGFWEEGGDQESEEDEGEDEGEDVKIRAEQELNKFYGMAVDESDEDISEIAQWAFPISRLDQPGGEWECVREALLARKKQ